MNKHWIRRNSIYRGYMLCKAWLARRRFGMPGLGMRYIWITGTDGKSTTVSCLYHILQQAGIKVGVISTVYIDVWDGIQDNHTHMTSLDHTMFWWLIQQARANWLTYMLLEVSSHAAYQYRMWPIRYMAAWCTNITREHLDFHRTMQHYARSKWELFHSLLSDGLWILPYDFTYRKWFDTQRPDQRLQTFSRDDERADIFVSDISQSPELSYELHIDGQQIHIDSKLLWTFNCDNMMIAAWLAYDQWVDLDTIKSALENYRGIPGRQEIVSSVQWVTGMVDFALTPDALYILYQALRDIWYTRIISVFGATGNRDQGKRPAMGAVAAQLCDVVIITEDENYHEDGMSIMKAVEQGVVHQDSRSKNFSYEMIQDRREAIKRGLEIAQPWDIVVVTGMANYTSRSMNEWSIPWNEREVIQECMIELGLDPND